MRKTLLTLAVLAAQPALAVSPAKPEFQCRFDTECADTECSDSGYTASLYLSAARPVASGATIITGNIADASETVALSGMITLGIKRLFNIESDAGARLLTIWPDGTARYVTHIADPAMAVSYLGRCEETK